MGKYTKQIELLLRLIDVPHITIETNSERTAIAELNKLVKCYKLFWLCFISHNQVINRNPSLNKQKATEKLLDCPFNEALDIAIKLHNNGILTYKGFKTHELSITEYESLDKTLNDYPHMTFLIIKDDEIKNVDRIINFDHLSIAEYSIEWKPNKMTQTNKLKTSELYQEIINKLKNFLGTKNEIPYECNIENFSKTSTIWFKNKDKKYQKTTEEIFNNLIESCNSYLTGWTPIPPCTPKQAIWVSRKMGVPEYTANKLNKFQASELLNVLFNPSSLLGSQDTINFYKEKLSQLQESKIIKINESQLRKIIREELVKQTNLNYNSIDKNHPNYETIKRVTFPFGTKYRTAAIEAAFQILGYDRFAFDGEIVSDNSIMDNPWDDAYSIIEWGVKNKGLNSEYLNRLKNSDKNYINNIQSGKDYWFNRDELKEILSILPNNLKESLIMDMINVSRINQIYNMINKMTSMNNGDNMAKFQNTLVQLMGDKKWTKQNLMEPVKQALIYSKMLPNK